jgi:hypothetical protein
MPLFFADDPRHWRHRAAEARAVADEIDDPQSKRDMEEVARTYDRMAERAEARLAKRLSGNPDRDAS